MIKWLEKWALKRLLKRVSKQVNNVDIAWEQYYDEIERKVADAIKKVLVDITKKAVAKAKDKVNNAINN